jgi:hypothetical protein
MPLVSANSGDGSVTVILCTPATLLVGCLGAYRRSGSTTSFVYKREATSTERNYYYYNYCRRRQSKTKKAIFDLLSCPSYRSRHGRNVMSGLLAAHLLGQEFDRIVCVEDFTSFQAVFQRSTKPNRTRFQLGGATSLSTDCQQYEGTSMGAFSNATSLLTGISPFASDIFGVPFKRRLSGL